MKAGWEIKSIGEFCTLATGGTPKRSEKDNFEGGKVKWLVSGDIHRKYIDNCEGRITQKGLKSSNTKFLPFNSVMIALNGQGKTRGTVALLKTEATCNQSLVSIMPNDVSEVLPEYLFINLYGRYEEIRRITGDSGNDRRGLNMNLIRAINVPIPPLEEQRRIVAVLDDAFAALDRARENVEANLADSQALQVQAIEATILSYISKAEEKPLGSYCAFVRGPFGGNLKKSMFVDSGYAVYEQKHAIRDDFNEFRYFIGEEKFSSMERFAVAAGDLIMSCSGTIGRTAIVPDDAPAGIINQALLKLRPNESLSVTFLNNWLKSALFQKSVERLTEGAAIKNIASVKVLKEISFPVLSKSEQVNVNTDIEVVETSLFQIIQGYKTQLTNISDFRQSLLERAFAGELTQSSSSIAVNDNERDERLSTATLVLAYEKHSLEQRHKTFGHVKAQKTLHLTESISGLDLGRQPKVRQAGPHDQEHFDRVEAWAAQNEVFSFVRRRTGHRGYDFIRGKNYASFLSEAKTLLADYQAGLSRFLPLITRMNSEEAEVFTTVHAAWNNLLADGKTPSDEDIVWAAREGWHESKMDITRQKFFDTIREIRRHDLEPDGSAKYVHGAQESLL